MRPSPLGRLGVAAAAIAYGAASGTIAGLVFTAMHVAQHGLWHVADQRWMIFPIVVAAGALIAYIGRFIPQQTLAEQAHSAADLRDHHRGRGLLIAASAFVAVVAGGAIGPEAGIIAIVGEMSALVTLRMKEAKLKALLPAVGVGASMGAVWGSPAAGAAYYSDELTPGMALNVVAAAAGFLGFVGVLQLSATPSLRMTTEISMDFTPVMVVGVFLAGILGAAVAFVYRWADNVSTDAMKNLQRRVGHPTWVVLGGSVILAAVLTAWPGLRFSGQEELTVLTDYPEQFAAGALIIGGLAKLAAVLLTVRSGWRGGIIFPLLLAGTMFGTGVAMYAADWFNAGATGVIGACAITAVGALLTGASGKPIVVILLVVFLVPGAAFIPLLAGVGAGMVVDKLAPPAAATH